MFASQSSNDANLHSVISNDTDWGLFWSIPHFLNVLIWYSGSIFNHVSPFSPEKKHLHNISALNQCYKWYQPANCCNSLWYKLPPPILKHVPLFKMRSCNYYPMEQTLLQYNNLHHNCLYGLRTPSFSEWCFILLSFYVLLHPPPPLPPVLWWV